MLEQAIAARCGDELHPCFIPNCSHPAIGRNQLVQAFIDSDCERLVFLDSDITFEPGALIKIAHRDVDFVAGCTVHKTADESYPIDWLPMPELWANERGLIEIAMIGTAFMSLSRSVFEILKSKYPGREYENYGKRATCYFETPFVPGAPLGALYGEDTFFCKLWRDAGGKIYLDPELEITHWDFNKPHVGHIGKWLKKRMTESATTIGDATIVVAELFNERY